MIRREHFTWAKWYDAKLILGALAEAAENERGVYAPDLPGLQSRRQQVGRWLREMGVPLMARRSGKSSIWFIISMFPPDTQRALAQEWRLRIISDAYAETCRAHMALKSHPHTEADAVVLSRVAIMLGERLGYDVAQVLLDIKPSYRHPALAREFGQMEVDT